MTWLVSSRIRSVARPTVLAVITAVATFAAGLLEASPAHASSTTKVTVTVASTRGVTTTTGFAGFSYEKDRIAAGVFNAKDSNLVNLFRLLGPSVVRIGGNLGDIISWNPSGAGGSSSEIAPSDVNKLAAFVDATGWQVIYGINLKKNTPANAASEATYVAHALGAHLLAFEIGNEPNNYLSESAYESAFETYVAAIRAKVPAAAFDGPGEADNTSWVSSFAAREKGRLAILSSHGYIGSNTTASITGMLASTAPSGRYAPWIAALHSAATQNGIGQWRFSEANSYFHGGANGVSNVKAAALWSLDLMREVAAGGGAGVNFHGGTSVQFPLYYTPITYQGVTPTGVQGVYYGQLLWHLAGTGAFHTASVGGTTGVTAWGIGNNVIIDNESANTLSAAVTLQANASSGRLYVLTGPGLSSPTVTIAGSAVTVAGAFSPKPSAIRVSAGRHVTITLAPHSAGLLVNS